MDTAIRLLISGCSMDRVDAHFFGQCLRGRHLLFLGDSLTRFQYMSLVQFLTLHSWTPFHNQSLPLSEVERHRWGSWEAYFQGTTARLQGLEICDCFRVDGQPSMLENRYWYSPFLNLRISMVFLLGAKAITRYHQLDFLNVSCGAGCSCQQAGCPAAKCSTEEAEVSYGGEGQAHMVGAALGAVRQLAQLAPLDAVFLNVGFHGGPGVGCYKEGDTAARDATMGSLQQLAKQLIEGQLSKAFYWKTTTTHKGNDYNSDAELAWVQQQLVPLGWRIYDTYGLSWGLQAQQSNYADTVHFVPAVYRGLNEALVVQLCAGSGAIFAEPPQQGSEAAPVCRANSSRAGTGSNVARMRSPDPPPPKSK